jgi:ribosome-associated protein
VSPPQGVSKSIPQDLPEAINLVAAAVEDLKATDLLVLDLREVASFTDYLVICTGGSDRHVQAIVDAIRTKLRESGVTPLHTEGYEKATWVLVDFVDFLVNVFTEEARDFYQLDRVWRDAPAVVGERPEGPPEPDETPGDGADAAASAADV